MVLMMLNKLFPVLLGFVGLVLVREAGGSFTEGLLAYWLLMILVKQYQIEDLLCKNHANCENTCDGSEHCG